MQLHLYFPYKQLLMLDVKLVWMLAEVLVEYLDMMMVEMMAEMVGSMVD